MTVSIDISDTYTYIRASGGICGTFLENGVGQIPTIVMLTQCTEAGKVSMILQYVCR